MDLLPRRTAEVLDSIPAPWRYQNLREKQPANSDSEGMGAKSMVVVPIYK